MLRAKPWRQEVKWWLSPVRGLGEQSYYTCLEREDQTELHPLQVVAAGGLLGFV